MFHRPVSKKAEEADEGVYEILHLEKASTGVFGKPLNGLNLIPVNKKLALTCDKEPTISILCNKVDPCARNRSNSTNSKLNAFLSVFKPPPTSPSIGTGSEEEDEAFMKRRDPSLKVNFAPLPSRETKCKVQCGLAARAALLNFGRPCRAGQRRYTGPTPRMVPRRSSSVPAGASMDDSSTGLSRRNTSFESSENLEPGPLLGRRHTSSELDTTCLSKRRSLPPTPQEAYEDEGARGRARALPQLQESEEDAQSNVSWDTTEESLRSSDSILAPDHD